MKQRLLPGFLNGERIYLREVRAADVSESYYRWMNDPEITQHLESRFYPYSQERLRAYVERLDGDPVSVFLAIGVKDGDKHIGNIKLGPINWIHRYADIGIIIGEKDYWGQGLATEAIRLVVNYAFGRLNLHRLAAGCYANNLGSARAFLKAGFMEEGVSRQKFFCQGEYVDEVLLALVCANGGYN